MAFIDVLTKYRSESTSERDKGDKFERLMQSYLRTDPTYSNQLKEVYLWEEFPYRDQFGGNDVGIDLVAVTATNEFWAIQCKCYQEVARIYKHSVDSFLSTSSKRFQVRGETIGFAQRLWIATTNHWANNAEIAITDQHPPVSRISLQMLESAPVDWDKLDNNIHGEQARTTKKTPLPHQVEALKATNDYYKRHDRGKLIMACGTGKTFTSLKIAEQETNGTGTILFLVPSIALLGQTLREWSADASENIRAVCICSDPKISKQKQKKVDLITSSIKDLALPATTDPANVLTQFETFRSFPKKGLTVVFSTYQSIDVIASVQESLLENGFPEFDFIICDEAHRTTGVTESGEDESAFVKVHDNSFIKAKKRLYMTATPRLFSDDSKDKAAEADAVLSSMDDTTLYGEEIYRIGFGEAVERGLLTDYKVLILTLKDEDVPIAIQKKLANNESEIDADDVTKLVGTVAALSKKTIIGEQHDLHDDPEPMKKAVAFCPNISDSKKISSAMEVVSTEYVDHLSGPEQEDMVRIQAKHMDGTMGALERDEILGWLKQDTPRTSCRVVTNVRVLSEGVDVPSLDAVMFLSARNSQVDVVQSVGRVMRRSPGKKYGYIIIPVVVPSDVEPSKALSDNKRFAVVWTVLNALRAHDDRFNAIVNKIQLNKRRPSNILIGRPEHTYPGDYSKTGGITRDGTQGKVAAHIAETIALEFDAFQSAVIARLVKKVGDRKYWENWAKDIAQVAERQIERIHHLIQTRSDQRRAFGAFLDGLQRNINPSIEQDEAVEMLAQHIITRPVFDALFEGYSFVDNNAVSIAMQSMLDQLESGSDFTKNSETLQKFYDSVRRRASGIDNAEGKQRIIIELYDTFFKNAFPKLVEQLGIVYTPVEVVDFILQSVNDVLKLEFGRSISDENIHVLDPFTGTGTFITRLIQSGLIDKKDLLRKYQHELHANEIVLLAYYIAAVNIENAFHDAYTEEDTYTSFEGIVLTDTFQLGETEEGHKLFSDMFPKNSERVERQKNAPIRVIVGNPPVLGWAEIC